METIIKVWHYLSHLEWTERKQYDCLFCDRRNFKTIVYEVSAPDFVWTIFASMSTSRSDYVHTHRMTKSSLLKIFDLLGNGTAC